MKVLALSLAIAVLSTMQACPPSPSAPDSGDAAPADAGLEASDADAGVYAAACSNLKALGCAEGNSETCAIVLKKAQEARQSDYDPACLASKHTKEEIRRCGRQNTKCP